jgi:hypothetical protein
MTVKQTTGQWLLLGSGLQTTEEWCFPCNQQGNNWTITMRSSVFHTVCAEMCYKRDKLGELQEVRRVGGCCEIGTSQREGPEAWNMEAKESTTLWAVTVRSWWLRPGSAGTQSMGNICCWKLLPNGWTCVRARAYVTVNCKAWSCAVSKSPINLSHSYTW